MANVGDPVGDAWRALSDELHAFLRSRVPSQADADDLLQDVFVRVLDKVGALRDADRIGPWVYQIARNALTDFYRRRSRIATQPVTEESAIDLPEPTGDGNHNQAIGHWLSSMIDRLPATQRKAVRMYELEGIPQVEIAQRLNVSLSGAKSRVQRGRVQLEKLLRGCCQLELDRRGNVIECEPNAADDCGRACECRDAGS
jgi:RNA polymerase sigma-70 factor (ECF subfamily)